MSSIVRAHAHSATIPIGDVDSGDHDAIDQPRHSDLVAPLFFFASKPDSEITAASHSVVEVLGYSLRELRGTRFTGLYYPGCTLNADDSSSRMLDLSNGQSLHSLRSVRNRKGDLVILSVRTTGVTGPCGGAVIRRHNIAEDVTESVRSFAGALASLSELSELIGRLSAQEYRGAERIRQGRMNREIADELQISERTIDRRRATVQKLLEVNTTAEMVAMLVQREMYQQWVDSAASSGWLAARNASLAVDSVRRISSMA